jgi:hypothetical protein
MSKKELNTYELPHQIQREFHQLMNSKENFKKNLSHAEQQKLETLYAQLKDVWNQSLIETLKASLEEKYQELRQMQKLIEQDWTEYERIVETELKEDIKQKSTRLNQESGRLQQTQNNLNRDIQIWKNDIIIRDTKLRARIKNLNLESELRLKESEEQEKLLKKEQNKLLEIETTQSEIFGFLNHHFQLNPHHYFLYYLHVNF